MLYDNKFMYFLYLKIYVVFYEKLKGFKIYYCKKYLDNFNSIK